MVESSAGLPPRERGGVVTAMKESLLRAWKKWNSSVV